MSPLENVWVEYCPECDGATLLSVDSVEWSCAKCRFAETNPERSLDNPNRIYDQEEDA